jgi:molybdopterin/thiamine biosynthesis adenylyltransferase
MTRSAQSVLVIGAGGLGGPAAIGVAAGGVGRVTLLDDDRVDASNLGRQVLFGDADIGRDKAAAAAAALEARFPPTRFDGRVVRFGRDDATRRLVLAHDIVVDGSDNFPTRFAANDLCVALGKPLIHGAAIRWQGQLLTILPGETPCLRCVFEGEPPDGAPRCSDAGVLSPLVGLVGAWMAEAALDVLDGRSPPTAGAMRVYDALSGRDRLASLGRDPACAACGQRRAERRDQQGADRGLTPNGARAL